MFKKNEMTIAEIHEELKMMGFGMELEVLAQMTASELRRFRKNARKADALVRELELMMTECNGRFKGYSDEE
jgi:precorrin-6B methylase 1